MARLRVLFIAAFASIACFSYGQIDTVTIAAGTPEDKELTAIGNEEDQQKKISEYQEFLQKYSSNPMAVAFANWQLSQAYQAAGDLPKAIDAGDKALASSPRNLAILSSQVGIAQQMKDNAGTFKYSVRGGEIYNSIDKQSKPADVSDDTFQGNIEAEKQNNKATYQFFQNSAFAVISSETDPKSRLAYVEKFTATFPQSGMDDQLTSYAMMSMAELRDNKRLIAYAEKVLAAKPDNMAALILLANTYVESPETASKAITFAEKAIAVAKVDEKDPAGPNRVSAGVAHCIIGRAYANQGKNLPSISELKTASSLLKGEDEQQYAVAVYFLGWNYAKLNKLTDARAILGEGAAIPGPYQAPTKELLTKVNSARSAGK